MRKGILHAVDRKGFCHVKMEIEQMAEFSSIGNGVCARNNRVRTSGGASVVARGRRLRYALVNSGRVLACLRM